jgi:hypothetical protein
MDVRWYIVNMFRFRKLSGDVRFGYVESAHGTFKYHGDHEATQAAMISTRQKLLKLETPKNPTETRLENFEIVKTIHGLGYVSLELNRHPPVDENQNIH